ncbi:MAG: LamG domain-containing protein [Candidatus Marsarchaeota archaeon]|nr:LamG domain-containing protein [Candidatus Marsarchaeota archaeon]
MALKHRHAWLKSRKGILLTLFTIVLFILMLSELLTYVVLNINYNNLETEIGRASGEGAMVQNINSSLSTFLYSSLSGALSGLTYYESTPSIRKDSFINNTGTALAAIMETGAYKGYSLSGYEGATLGQYIAALVKQAGAQGASISITNGTLSVVQSGAFTIMASYTAMLTVNQSGTTSDYPIDAVANVSTGSRPYLLGAEQGIYETLVPGTSSPNATLVGNMYAKAGSTSPYMFAYGTVVYYPGEPNCGTIASGYKSSSYILATPNAADISQSVCGMAGLVTNITNSSTPIVPYLLYKNASIMSYLQNSPSLLLDGQGLALLNTTPLQQAVQYGYAYASPYMPTYLQRAQNSLFSSSPNGFYTFSPLNVKVTQFNGASSYISTGYAVTKSNATWTLEAWMDPANLNQLGIVVENGWDNNVVGNGYGFGVGNGGGGAGSQLQGLFSGVSWLSTGYAFPSANTWYDVVMTRNQSGITSFYVNGVKIPFTTSLTPKTPNDTYIGSDTGVRYFDGSIADVQIYNTTLSPSEISTLYREGISGGPIGDAKLVGWWPLNGNANDYSGNGNNGVATNVIYTSLLNSPTANLVEGVLNCANLDQCSSTTLQHLYLNPLPLEHAGMGFMNETTSLGMMNAALPDALKFDGVSSYVDAGNPASLQFSSGTTMVLSAWVKITNCNHGGAIIGHGTSSYTLYYYPPSAGACSIDFASSAVANIGAGVPITTGAWHNVVVVNSIGTNVYIYIDGTQYGPYTFTNTYSYTEDLRIGDSQSDSGYFFNGSIADVQIYKTALTLQQVQQLYLNNSVLGVAQVAYWPLGSGMNGLLNETPDIVSGNTGYLYGSSGLCTNSQVVNGQCGPSYTPP